MFTAQFGGLDAKEKRELGGWPDLGIISTPGRFPRDVRMHRN